MATQYVQPTRLENDVVVVKKDVVVVKKEVVVVLKEVVVVIFDRGLTSERHTIIHKSMPKSTNSQPKSRSEPIEWNLFDSRVLLRQNQQKKTEEMAPTKPSAAKMESTDAKPATSQTKSASAYGTILGKKAVVWAERPENAVPAKLLAELNEKNGEKRFESKKRNRRVPWRSFWTRTTASTRESQHWPPWKSKRRLVVAWLLNLRPTLRSKILY